MFNSSEQSVTSRASQRTALSGSQRALLLMLADPEPGTSTPVIATDADVWAVLDAARAHAVLPVVRRRLAELCPSATTTLMEKARLDVAILAGQSMRLMHVARTIAAAFEHAGVRFSIVKGPVFAERLYPGPSDRSFTDVDFLVHHDDLDRANALMSDMAFVSSEFADRPSEVFGEYKWEPPDRNNVLIELHANLVHSPKLRANLSLTYETLLRAGDGDPAAPAALMLVAALHASMGHQFERLQLLVDVLQAARYTARNFAEGNVFRACQDMGATLAVASALDLAAASFSEPIARTLADRICASHLRIIAKALVSPRLATRTQDSSASWRSWRRKIYREMLARA